MAQHTTLMTEGSIRRKMLGFALPILAGYFFQQLYSTVDALIVGNYLDADALAAVTSTGSYTYLMIGFVAGFATGAGIIIARHIGAGPSLPAISARGIGKALKKRYIPPLRSAFFSASC